MLTKSIGHVIYLQLSKWYRSPKAWLSFVLLIVIVGGMANDYARCAHSVGSQIQISEVFVAVCSYRVSFMFYVFGLSLLLSDAPFFDDNAVYYISRLGRKHWHFGIVAYIFLASFLYAVVILAIGLPFTLAKLSLHNEWSQVTHLISKNSLSIDVGQGIYISPAIIKAYTPYEAMLMQLLLLILYGCFMSMMIYVVNLATKKGAGIIVALAVHVFMLVLSLDNLPIARRFSLYNYANLASIADSSSFVVASLILFSLNLLMATMSFYLIKNTDIAPATFQWIE